MKKQTRTALILVLLLVAGAGVGFAVLNEPYTADPGVEYDAGTDGPSVTIGEQSELQAERPFPNDNTVDLHPHAEFRSTAHTHARVMDFDDDGWIRLTDLDVSQGELEVDSTDRQLVAIEGDATALEFRDAMVDGGQTDIDIATDSTATLTIHEMPTDEYVVAVDADGNVVDKHYVTDGTASFTLDSSASLSLETRDVSIDDPDPADGETIETQDGTEISVAVEHPQFETGGSVSVEFRDASDDSVIGTETMTEPGRVGTTWNDLVMGSNQWYVVVDDGDGTTVESETFTLNVPSELEIRDEMDPDNLVTTESEAEVTFFSDDTVVTRTTTDGVISLEGLPADESFVVQVDADGYVTRQSIVPSIIEQQQVFLLPDDVESVSVRFDLDDSTGTYPAEDSRILIEKPITRDGESTYEVIAGDDYGAQGFSTVLAADQRYRAAVINTETGERKSLGPYAATQSETVTLQVDSIEFDTEVDDIGYRYGASYENETEPRVEFGFEADNEIESLSVEIRERGGDEQLLLSETVSNVQQFNEIADLSQIDNPDETSYVIEWEAVVVDEDGETFEVSGSEIVGADQMPVAIPGVGDDVLHVVSVLLLFLVGGLFSAANVEVGGVVVSLTAAAFWFIGMLPGAVSGLFIAAALLLSVMWMVRSARGEQ